MEKEVPLNFGSGSFEEIYSRFWEMVLRQTKEKLRNDEIAEEVAQEVFVRLYRFRDRYDPKQSLVGWIRTVTRNVVCDWFRSQRNEISSTKEEVTCEDLPGSELDAETLLLLRMESAAVKSLLREMTLLQRKVLSLRLFRKLSYPEIAETIGVSVDAVKCAAYRGRLTLKEKLG